MKIYYQKVQLGLVPLNESDQENHAKIKNGAIFCKDFKKIRNPEFHALVFRMLNEVFKFQDQFDDFDNFRDRVTLLSGSYSEEIIIDHKGNSKGVIRLKSWSFAKMDEYEFRAFFEKIKAVCATHFCKTNEQFNLINRYD